MKTLLSAIVVTLMAGSAVAAEPVLNHDLLSLPDDTKFIVNQKMLLPKATHYKSFINTTVAIGGISSQLDCGFKYAKARTQDRIVKIASVTFSSIKTSFGLGPDFEPAYEYSDSPYVDMYKRGAPAKHYVEFSFSDSEIKIECASSGELPAFLTIKQLKEVFEQANIILELPPRQPLKISSEAKINDDDFSNDGDWMGRISVGSQIVVNKMVFLDVRSDSSAIDAIENSRCEFRHEPSSRLRVLLPGTYRIIPGGESARTAEAWTLARNSYSTILTLSENGGSELHIACVGYPLTVGQFRELLIKNGMELLRASR